MHGQKNIKLPTTYVFPSSERPSFTPIYDNNKYNQTSVCLNVFFGSKWGGGEGEFRAEGQQALSELNVSVITSSMHS